MMNKLICILLFSLMADFCYSQVAVNTDGSAPNPCAILDLKANNKGLLLPRLTTMEMFSIPSPLAGLMVYNTTKKQPVYYDGSTWRNMDGTACTVTTGSQMDGGIVCYVDSTGKAGLIAAPEDIRKGYGYFEWYTLETEIGSGYQNTYNYMSHFVPGSFCVFPYDTIYAAKDCFYLVTNGFSDWFLPSKDELNLMYVNLKQNGLGSFQNSDYLSSSSTTGCDSWVVTGKNFGTGATRNFGPCGQARVRPVRTFGKYSAPIISNQKVQTGSTSAKVKLTINPSGYNTNVILEYGPSVAYGNSINVNLFPLEGNNRVNLEATIPSLTTGSTYHCRIKATNAMGTTYSNDMPFIAYYGIGETFAGGTVIYVDSTWVHGLTATTGNLGQADWGCNGIVIGGADGTAIGSGLQNTIDIVNGCPEANSAARICYDLVLNGYSDWFLPSKDELALLISTFYPDPCPGPLVAFYSSSEIDATHAWGYKFEQVSGGTASYPKNGLNLFAVKAIRAY